MHEVIHFTGERDDVEVEVAMQYNAGYTETLASFVNSIQQGAGVHMKPGLRRHIHA